MEFAFTDEQQMIRDTAEAFLSATSGSESVRQAMATESGFDAALWKRICTEMYWQAIHIPEAQGGMGLGYVELVAVAEQMGRSLLCAPFFSSVCLATNALLVAKAGPVRDALLEQFATGSTGTLAWMGSGRDWSAEGVQAQLQEDGNAWRLTADYRHVVDGHSAEHLILAARDSRGRVGLFAVSAEAEGVTRQWTPTMDQTRKLATVSCVDLKLTQGNIVLKPGQDDSALQKALDLATIALAAEQAGVAQQCLQLAVDYTAERVQFGRTIASYQAVKHKAADMMLKAEAARSAIYYAACIAQEALEGGSKADELSEAASVAKAWCSDAAFYNAGCCIQLFGGVGFTWEYDPQLYFKRAKSAETFLGDASVHRERIATLLMPE